MNSCFNLSFGCVPKACLSSSKMGARTTKIAHRKKEGEGDYLGSTHQESQLKMAKKKKEKPGKGGGKDEEAKTRRQRQRKKPFRNYIWIHRLHSESSSPKWIGKIWIMTLLCSCGRMFSSHCILFMKFDAFLQLVSKRGGEYDTQSKTELRIVCYVCFYCIFNNS